MKDALALSLSLPRSFGLSGPTNPILLFPCGIEFIYPSPSFSLLPSSLSGWWRRGLAGLQHHLPPPPQPTAETLKPSSCPIQAFSLLLYPLSASSGSQSEVSRVFPSCCPSLLPQKCLQIDPCHSSPVRHLECSQFHPVPRSKGPFLEARLDMPESLSFRKI